MPDSQIRSDDPPSDILLHRREPPQWAIIRSGSQAKYRCFRTGDIGMAGKYRWAEVSPTMVGMANDAPPIRPRKRRNLAPQSFITSVGGLPLSKIRISI
jgi:hypothetical protein